MKNGLISIIIPTTGRMEMFSRNLRLVLETTRHLPCEYIVVVDNDEPTANMARVMLRLSGKPHKIDESSTYRGSCGAINAGLGLSEGEYIIGVGDDTEVQPKWLDEALRVMREKFPEGDGMVGLNDCHQDGNYLATAPLLGRKFIIKYMGGAFGIPHYKKWFGDVEMTSRAKKAGKYAYAPNAIIKHVSPQSGGRAEDETDLRFKQFIREDEALCHRRDELGWPDDFKAIITE